MRYDRDDRVILTDVRSLKNKQSLINRSGIENGMEPCHQGTIYSHVPETGMKTWL